MADQEERPSSRVGNIVSQVTVKALQEFETGDMSTSRPTSGKPGSRPGSGRPGSTRGSRPGSAALSPSGDKPSSRPSSRRSADRPGSAARPPSGTGSRRSSGVREPPEEELSVRGSRPSSARPGSGMDQPEKPSSAPGAMKGGIRPGSAARKTPSPVTRKTPSPVTRKTPSPVTDEPPVPAPAEDQEPDEEADVPEAQAVHSEDYGFAPYDDQPSQDVPQTTILGDEPPMDPDDEDDDEDDYEEDEDEEDAGLDAESDSEGENEMVVLDPDHPLMRRFQAALRSHLDKQSEKVTLELRELTEAMKNRHQEREDIGVELYGIQQELARHQMMLERNHDEFAQTRQDRVQKETELTDVRGMYKDQQNNVNTERKKGSELQTEVENLALRLFYMQNAKEDVRSDISVMRRAAEKAESEVAKAEEDKQKQDLYVDRLVERMDHLREEIAMYEAQLSAQSDETKAAKEALSEAHMEIEAISLEKKQLFQQWNSSLIGMRRRDEAHSAMQEALDQQHQRILSLLTEIEGYKRSITKEQEQNEKLTLILSKTETDIAIVKKQLAQCQAKHEALKNEYATYTRMLHETEQALIRATTDQTTKTNEANALRKLIEKEFLEKVKLEDDILEMLRSQLTMDKASQYTTKLTGKLRKLTKDLESQVATVENEISKNTLEVAHTRTKTEHLAKIMEELDSEIMGKNEIISKSEAEMTKRNAIIERKQGVIDQFNKKLEQMIASAGGVELGPLEIQINSLQKSIDAELQEITELQQMWLRDQTELVRIAKEKDAQSGDVDNLKKQLTILSQRKIRTENEINMQRNETADIEREIRNMHNDILKLNTLLNNESGMHHNLQQGNILMENDFVGALKEAEMESILMQANLDAMKEEKERLLNSLVEAERQIMLWEKKTQLARETRAAVDSEVGQGEMRAMRAEIHRMQVRYTQLMKQQESMIQEMEKAVSRRDTIVTRGDAQAKMNKKVLTKGTFHRQLAELKKRIKTTIQDANGCDGEIRELRSHQQELSGKLEEKQLNTQQLANASDTLDGDIDRLVEQKQKNMTDLLNQQQKAKYYQQVKDGKYTRLCKTDTALETERQKQIDRMQTLTAITDRLIQEFPHAQPALKKVTMTLATKIGAD